MVAWSRRLDDELSYLEPTYGSYGSELEFRLEGVSLDISLASKAVRVPLCLMNVDFDFLNNLMYSFDIIASLQFDTEFLHVRDSFKIIFVMAAHF